jgi:hypothetical protein
MKEESSINPSAVRDESESESESESETDVASLLKRMQQQLLFLERKIDLLISQSHERPSRERSSPDRPFPKRPFSKPFRSFDHTQRHGKGEHGHSPRERDSVQGHFYERRPGEKKRSPNPKKKPFSYKRKDRE